MTVSATLPHGLQTSVYGSEYKVEYDANLALLDPDRITSGLLSARPTAGVARRFYFATDQNALFYDNGTAWVQQAASAPAAHAATHASGGGDTLTLAQSQITNLATDLAAKAADGAVVHNTGTETVAGIKTFSTGAKIKGVTDGSSAAVGDVGEIIQSVVTTSTSFGTSSTYFDATSIALTAGVWAIDLVLYADVNGATITGSMAMGVGSASGTGTTGLSLGSTQMNVRPPDAASSNSYALGGVIANITGSESRYLKLWANYSVATPVYRCRLTARRIR